MYKTRTPAIYLITNLKNKKRYVGGTTWLEHRITTHKSEIRTKKHGNSNIQKDLIKFGYKVKDFSFAILEILDMDDIDYVTEREQYWMDKISPEYNVNQIAGKYIGDYIRTPEAMKRANDKRIGRKHSKDEKEKRAKSLREYYKTHTKVVTEAQKKHLSEINMGENNPNWGLKRSKKTRKAISEANSKYKYVFKHSSGEIKEIVNLYKNSRELGMHSSSAFRLARGEIPSCKGWTFVERIIL